MHLALLLVHPAFLKNGKTGSTFFLLLKGVFFLKNHTSHFCTLFFSLFSLRCCIFFGSLATVRLDSVKVKVPMFSVVVVDGDIRGTHLSWVCVLVYCRSCGSTWSVKDLRINLIRMLILKLRIKFIVTDQLDP